MTGNWPDADDLVQATCARAIERLKQWEPGTRLDSWMYRIAQNLHRNDLRSARTRSAHLQVVDANDTDLVSQQRPIDRMELKDVDAAMLRLPPEQRTALLLVAVEGRNYRDTADVLGVSEGTVASRVSRARSTLAAMFDREG